MSGAGNPLGYDYRDPRHVERYGKLVVRNPDGSTEGKHPRDADVDVMREIHDPGAAVAGDPGQVHRLFWRIGERSAQVHGDRMRLVAIQDGEQSVPRSS